MRTLLYLLVPLIAVLAGCGPKVRPPNIAETDVELVAPTADFTFGPGDTLSILVWRHDDLTMDVTVAPDGAISYPLVGRLQVAGMTYDQVVATLTQAISQYYNDAQVAVNVKTIASQKVFVFGEVASPQVLQLTQQMSMLEALVRTGGINSDARTSNVLLIRGGMDAPKLYAVNIDAIYGKGDFSQMVYLQRDDIVVVPAKTITNVERFFRHVSAIIAPAVSGSAVYRNVVSGGAQVPPNQ